MKYIRRLSLPGITLLLASALSLATGGMVLAAVSSSSGTVKIDMALSQVTQPNNRITISSQLTDAGKPLGNEPVAFQMAADFFGTRPVNLGTVKTDATGTATLIYQPTWDGTYDFTADFNGDGNHPPVQITRTITYSGPVPQYSPDPVALKPVRVWITPVIYAGVGLFWLFVIFVGIRTIRGIRRSGV